MGKQTNLYCRGTKGNVIYYELNGGYYMRRKPGRIRQTKATKASAATFGIAVRVAKNMRSGLEPALHIGRDRKLMYRLNTAMYKSMLSDSQDDNKSLRPATALIGFSFNEATLFSERMKPSLHVDWKQQGEVVLTIPVMNPAVDIAAPVRTVSVTLQLAVCCCHLPGCAVAASYNMAVEIPYDNNYLLAQDIVLPVNLPTGSLAVLAGTLKYTVRNRQGTSIAANATWMPGGVIDAVYL